MKEIYYFMKYVISKFLYLVCELYIKLYFLLFKEYIVGLAVQGEYLYRQSSLFKERWQNFGIDFARKMFEKEIEFWYLKAKKEPFVIRWQIFVDTIIYGKDPRPYYINEGE